MPGAPVAAFRCGKPNFPASAAGGNGALARRAGLRYEARVERALCALASRQGFRVERNPWFRYTDASGASAYCSPDLLLFTCATVAVIEVKLTWVADAAAKLAALYCPVVRLALSLPTEPVPLVICRNLVPGLTGAANGFRAALDAGLLHWPDIGGIEW